MIYIEEIEKAQCKCLWGDKCAECTCEDCDDYSPIDECECNNIVLEEYNDNLHYRHRLYERMVNEFEG